MSEYKEIPTAELENWKASFWTSYLGVKYDKEKEAVAKQLYSDYLGCLKELKSRDLYKEKGSTKATTMTPTETNLLKDLRMSVEKIPELAPGGDAASYLADLENSFKLYLADNKKFEPEFVRLAKTRLCQSYLTTVTNAEASPTTFDDYKTYVRKTFGSKKNVYQSMDALFDVQMESDVQDFAVRLQNEVSRVRTEVEDIFEIHHESKSRTIDQASMFQLFGTMILLKQVRTKLAAQDYNFVVRGLEKCFDISSASAVIKTYMDQSAKVDELGHDSSRTFHARQGGPRKPATNRQQQSNPRPAGGGQSHQKRFECFRFKNSGKCDRSNCRFEPCRSKREATTAPKPQVNYNQANFFAGQDFYEGTLDQ